MEMNIDCVIHFENNINIGSRERIFTSTTFEKFSLCRKQWLSLDNEYKGFVSVARKSLDRIPVGTIDVTELNESNSKYHIGCYQLFTNLSKFERARLCQQRQQQHLSLEDDDNNDVHIAPQSSSATGSRRLSTRLLTTNTLSNTPISSGSVLPRICMICKRAGSIYVTDSKVGQEIS